ncbi:hypothetical protein AB0M46_44205 [Dactylosporangium sp. NPDC051485]|uniref:hypothetical protein n=1 Tax=Dactylosporangium sp. NPDC051485 TaxID=3154846 RepID=UPI003443E586
MRDDYYRDDLPGHDTWTPIDHSKIQVNVESLQHYAKLVKDELGDFTENLKNGVLPMTKVQSTFAGFGEGKLYRGTHAKAVTAVGDLLKDVGMSLNAILQASTGIYFEYLGGDDLSKAGVDDVYDVFWPSDGRPTLQDEVNKQQPQGQTGGDGTTDPAPIVPPAGSDDSTSSYFNQWDKGFSVGDGGATYKVSDNQSDMMGAPEDPLKPKN